MRLSTLILLFVIACNTPPTAPVAPPPPAPVTEMVRFETSLVFEGDVLTSCVESRFRAVKAEGFTPEQQETFLRGTTAPEGLTRVSGTCQDAAARPALARCTWSQGTPEHRVAVAIYHYDFDTVFRDDSEMRACLVDGGTWGTVERGSREYYQAHRQTLRRRYATR